MTFYPIKFNIPKYCLNIFPTFGHDNCKLLVFDKKKKKLYHKNINYLIDHFKYKDIIIRNNTKVLPCKLTGYKNKSKISLILLKAIDKSNNIWETLINNARKIRIGNTINFFYYNYNNNKQIISSNILENTSSRGRLIKILNIDYKTFIKKLNLIGNLILPKIFNFINLFKNFTYYQNFYAKKEGALFIPTSGIQFSKQFFLKLKYNFVKILDITNHFNYYLYNLLNLNDFNKFLYNPEFIHISSYNVHYILKALINNSNICAIGLNTYQTIESCQKFIINNKHFKGYFNNFIDLPNKNKSYIINNLLTFFPYPNTYYFHLLADYCGYNNIIHIYNEAIKYKYCLFNYGDLLFIKI
ncbi:S-adenosylmethionine:tRNA ribosyltransferase-isomerase [Candidatus Shikimatogenerans bostrichidophilus]|uniref:S-adenosylmethionine:tRNA ribosyltransferase-isomerase n=1 Tax=Candidatus Shikimatogenerans bostrichidophilus TaxID=2943807 RepID=UPI0029670727